MNHKTIKIGEQNITFAANVWTLLEFKRIFKKDWYVARNEQLVETIEALKFQEKYAGLTDEQFAKLSKEKQEEYWQDLESIKIDTEFTLSTIYAMAASGGYKGTQQEFFSIISPKDLAPDSELMQAIAELTEELAPEVKKNRV